MSEAHSASAADHNVHIHSPGGTFIGYSRGGVNYFHSIAYSQIPGRFERPQPIEHQGTVDVRTPHPHNIALSITAPASCPPGGAPVIVYVHGGRFEHGSHEDPRAEGTATARHGVVVVQVDYRVQLAGFAKFPEDEYFYYRGVDDVAVGLEWIQRNIEAFGGDPSNVTLVGQSAGATLSLWLSRRDHYKGAFRRVVALSPCFPRQGYEHRKATLRQILKSNLDKRSLSQLSEEQLEKGYRAFAKKFHTDMALGPYPLNPAELADIPIVMSSTLEEFYDIPAGIKVDSTPARRAIGWWAAPTFGMRRERFGRWADLSGAGNRVVGRLIGDSTIRQWVAQIAAGAPQAWMWELRRTDMPAIHSKDIRFFFGNTTEGPDDLHQWLLEFARTGHVGFEPYGEDHVVREYVLNTGQARMTHGSLDYVAQAFAD